VITVLVGAYGYWRGWVSLGQITTAVLYVESLSGPLDRLVGEVDRLQVGAASTARLLGIATVPQDREPGEDLPTGPELVGRDLRFAYRPGHDVLHGIDIWAGCCPGSTDRAPVRCRSATSTWSRCRWRCCAPRSRW
jgi:ABC-type multidrug transport system fused ATPase/permease subunit